MRGKIAIDVIEPRLAADNVQDTMRQAGTVVQCQIHALFDKACVVPSEGTLRTVWKPDVKLSAFVRRPQRRFAGVDAAGNLYRLMVECPVWFWATRERT